MGFARTPPAWIAREVSRRDPRCRVRWDERRKRWQLERKRKELHRIGQVGGGNLAVLEDRWVVCLIWETVNRRCIGELNESFLTFMDHCDTHRFQRVDDVIAEFEKADREKEEEWERQAGRVASGVASDNALIMRKALGVPTVFMPGIEVPGAIKAWPKHSAFSSETSPVPASP